MDEKRFILFEKVGKVGVITLNRPEYRNAQHPPLLVELDETYRACERDKDVRVIVLKANGPAFSAGHDIGTAEGMAARAQLAGDPGAKGRYDFETDYYIGFVRRWRDIPKPTIAAVHGYCIAAGLMLAWPCDLIIASEDAQFADPVLRMGIPGVEFFAHPYELGIRKAKEMLFTGEFISAQEAHRLGMVNRVVPRDRLVEETMALAHKIAEMDPFALALAKQAVNQALDAMGQRTLMQAVFNMHELAHTHQQLITGNAIGGMDVEKMKARTQAK